MKMTLAEIARIVEGEVIGAADVVISGVAPIDEAKVGDITFVANRKYAKQINTTRASAIIIAPQQREIVGKNLVVVSDPYVALGKLLKLFYPLEHEQRGISPEAYVEEGAIVSPEANIFPRAFISHGAKIEKGVVIYPGVYVGRNVSIGEDSVIYANVAIYHSCIIGKRVILHSGVVIGGDGFGFAETGKENVKIPQIGFVQIDDDVEIGANSTVDRATMGKTWIGRNVKIDNLVQIAHNVVIGDHSVLVAQVAVAGSTHIGSKVIIAGQAGVAGHLHVGNGAVIGAKGAVTKDVAPGEYVIGVPAMPAAKFKRAQAGVMLLPKLKERVAALDARIRKLEESK